MFQVAHPPSHDDLAMAMQAMPMAPPPSTPPPRKWIKQWLPQDTILNSGKLTLLKWVTEDMVTQFSGVAPAMEEQDAEENEILYLCTFEGCGKGFADAGSLRKHAHTHGEKQFICHYDGCGKRFVDSSKLKRHFLIHTGEKHFVCPFEGCGKAFSLDFNLRSHMRTHTGENYHACPYEDCGKRYAHEYKLRAHMRNHHDKSIPEMTPPPMNMEHRDRDREREQQQQDVEMARYRDMERERERGRREMETIEREAVVKPKSVVLAIPPPNPLPLPTPLPHPSASDRPHPNASDRPHPNASDRPFACPHPGCTKRYIHEYKLNLHLRNSHADENREEYEERGRDSDGEDDVDEGFNRTPVRGSGRGKLKLISKREPVVVEGKVKKRRGGNVQQKEIDLNLRMRVSNESVAGYYGGGGNVKPVKQQVAPDSEETEEDDAENTEDEGYNKYYQSRSGRGMADDEDTEDDGDQF